MAPKGMSVHVGVNKPDPKFGLTPLNGCRADATSLQNIATIAGFQTKRFLDEEAIFDDVTAAILDAAKELKDGDIFLFTFSGHGSFQPTIATMDGGKDETILLRDCVLIDNYVRRNLWSQFKKGVRILGIADSCHSATVLLNIEAISADGPPAANAANSIPNIHGVEGLLAGGSPESRSLAEMAVFEPPPRRVHAKNQLNRGFTRAEQARIIAASPEIHKKILNQLLSGEAAKLKASLLTLAACRDSEEALDLPDHGAFTKALLEVWNGGEFKDDYGRFIEDIQAKFSPAEQFPNMQVEQVDDGFLKQRPFTIEVLP